MQMVGEQEQQMFYIIFGQLSQPVWQHFLGRGILWHFVRFKSITVLESSWSPNVNQKCLAK